MHEQHVGPSSQNVRTFEYKIDWNSIIYSE